MPVSEADVIAAVRAESLAPSTLSDEDLMKVMEGSLCLSRIRLRLAVFEFKMAVLESPLGRSLIWLVIAIDKWLVIAIDKWLGGDDERNRTG